MSPVMLSTDALTYGYAQGKSFFEPLNLCCHVGEITAILGTNGRGKTTLLHTLLGNLNPLSGRVHRNGQIGFVPQIFTPPFSYRVLDMVLMGRAASIPWFASPSAQDIAIATEALETLDIASLMDQPFSELSGGQRQLVLIARALASRCQTLILDEPMAALDLQNQAIVLRLLKRLAKEQGLCIVLTTHDPAQVLAMADQALLLMDDQQYLYGRSQDVLNEDNLLRLYGIAVKQVTIDIQSQRYRTLVPVFTLTEDQ